MRNYDPVDHPIVVGDSVFLGSSAEDRVLCLDVATGRERWSFFADGPIRVAPHWDGGRVYFGSDDGCAYALDARSGELLWRRQATEDARRFIHDGRIISTHPVRSGVLVEAGTAYFSASMFPWLPSSMHAVDAASGSVGDPASGSERETWVRELGTGWTLEGALLASSKHLVLPQGRVAPLLFDRSTGEPAGSLEGGGGSFVLLTEDERILHGPGNKDGWITDSDSSTRTRLASYAKGNAIVVTEDVAYLLSDTHLSALIGSGSRPKPEGEAGGSGATGMLWTRPTKTPYVMILAGEHLYCGGDGVLEARSTSDGSLVWQAEVPGQVHGLAVAQGRLFAATTVGELHAFEPTGPPRNFASMDEASEDSVALAPSPPIGPGIPDGRVDRWVFQANGLERIRPIPGDPREIAIIGNREPGRPPARRQRPPEFEPAGRFGALALGGAGDDFTLVQDFRDADLPTERLSVEAWVRIDEPQEWGGILGATQDNGELERGWLLGYRQRRFGWSLKGTEGSDRLSWILDDREFEPGTWHHVVGTYDGAQMVLYVDGEERGRGEAQGGPIHVPEAGFYQMGAYRDQDEYFPMVGAMHEVALYRRALRAREVRDAHARKSTGFPTGAKVLASGVSDLVPSLPRMDPVEGPVLRFLDRDRVEVRWRSAGGAPWEIAVFEGEEEIQRHGAGSGPEHHLVLSGLRSATPWSLRLLTRVDGLLHGSEDYECDPLQNLERPDVQGAAGILEGHPEAAKIDGVARAALEGVDGSRGFLLVLGVNDGAFLEALARHGDHRVVALCGDPRGMDTVRRNLAAAGLQGSRIALLPAEGRAGFGLPLAFANGVLMNPTASAEALELATFAGWDSVRPVGGIAWLDPGVAEHWVRGGGLSAVGEGDTALGRRSLLSRGALEGAQPWTHMYGGTDNAAYTGETLSGARRTSDFAIQWAGRPGPRYQSDRQNRKPAPLAAQGRLYLQGLRRAIALDAYNGEILWSLEMPELMRFNVPRSSSNWCADGSSVYMALDARAQVVDGSTGAFGEAYPVLRPARSEGPHGWGYIAREGSLLLGSAVREGAQYTAWWGSQHWYDGKSGEGTGKVLSDALFALDLPGGVERWRREGGLVLDATITLGDGHLFFLEHRGEELIREPSRRVHDARLWEQLFLVCLDVESGDLVWEREAKPMAGDTAVYLVHAEGQLVLTTSKSGQFAVYAFDAGDGSSAWRTRFAWEVDHHGKHLSRPLVVEGELYLRPLVLDLASGETLVQAFPGGHQCGSYVASKEALFLRAGELAVWDRGADASRWTRVRPDCWISSIPAEGMLLSPEGGGGCSCGSWIETSMGFLPLGPGQ